MLKHRIASAIAIVASLALPSFVNAGAHTPFDGQYILPNASNSAVEWWWAQAIAEPEGSNPPAAFQVLFYQGYPLQVGPRDPALPEYYITINGFFPNATQFALTVPATSGSVTPSHGGGASGAWGDVGRFEGAHDQRTWHASFSAKEFGVEGDVLFVSNAPRHLGCNTTSDAYFTSAVPKAERAGLSPAEQILFTQIGWATSVPGGTSHVNLTINGTPLRFTGQGYHDANWSPAPLNAAVSSWFFGSAQAGPYDLSYIAVAPLNSSRVLTTGFLSRNGIVLQNQCSVRSADAEVRDRSIVTPYGLQHDTVAGVDVPVGFLVEYILENGERFSFNLTAGADAQNPDQSVYHRWVGRVQGGKVDEKAYDGLTVFEWLNPGQVVYTPGEGM